MTYTSQRLIGRGGFGIVEEVIDSRGQHFARKTLSVPPTVDERYIRPRFNREVKYQGAISHENVVTILDANLVDSPPWFIMPLAVCSVKDDLDADRTLGGDPKKVLFDTLAGLEEIHRKGYLHRDLKPENNLKFSVGGVSVYAVSDFGLMAVGEDASTTLTSTGMAGGTVRYQAPECASDFHRATVRSDIYSFGAILHDIFAPSPRRLPHDELTVPGDLGPIVEKCTKRNVYRRYKNVEELRQALFTALDAFDFQFESQEEKHIVDMLQDEASLPNADGWDQIFDFLDANTNDARVVGNVFRALSAAHIEQLHTEQTELFEPLARIFSEYIKENSFGFDYCDVLATKAQYFYDLGDLQVKTYVALALLEMGTSHNRWFVERKFMAMAGKSISDDLAERIAVEVDVTNTDFRALFEHLKLSIRVQSDGLHPKLQALLSA